MSQAASLQETIAKGKRHYYDGLTFRKWKSGMLNLYGHDTMPFLDEAWNAIVGEAQSRSKARTNRDKQTGNSKSGGTRARPNNRHPRLIIFLGNATMLTLNVIACVALFMAWKSGVPYSLHARFTWICFAAFAWTGFWRMKDGAAIICLPAACLFNPFYSIRLTARTWSIIDLASLVLLAALVLCFVANPKK